MARRNFFFVLFCILIVTASSSEAEERQGLTPPLVKLVTKNPVAHGGWLYTQNCYRCHLAYGQTRQGRGVSTENLRKIVENGKTSTQMSGFAVLAGGTLKQSEIEALLRYITTWESMSGPPAIAPELLIPPASDPAGLRPLGLVRFPPVQGDVKIGRVLYLTHCSTCHNPDRSGYIGRRLLPPWDGMRPDLFLKATVKSGIPGSLMPGFATDAKSTFRPKEIDDLVSFLLEAPVK